MIADGLVDSPTMQANVTTSNLTENCFGDNIAEVVSTVVPIFFGLIGITGLIGNVLVVLVVLSNPQMRSTTNILIINLSMADLLFVIFCVPFTATDYMLAAWPFGDVWCKVVQYLIAVTAHTSIYTLVLMSLDRFLAVVYPIESRTIRTERNTLLAIGILWGWVLLLASPALFFHGTFRHEDNLSCIFTNEEYKKTYHIVFFSSSYVIPLILISGLYLRMLSRLWRTVVGGNMSVESHRGRKRVTRLVVIVVAAFALMWLPIQVILVLKSVDAFEICTHLDISIQIVSHILAYCSSCINPLLYAFLSENFRKAFRKVVYCSPGGRHYIRHHPVPTKTTRTGSSCAEIV